MTHLALAVLLGADECLLRKSREADGFDETAVDAGMGFLAAFAAEYEGYAEAQHEMAEAAEAFAEAWSIGHVRGRNADERCRRRRRSREESPLPQRSQRRFRLAPRLDPGPAPACSSPAGEPDPDGEGGVAAGPVPGPHGVCAAGDPRRARRETPAADPSRRRGNRSVRLDWYVES